MNYIVHYFGQIGTSLENNIFLSYFLTSHYHCLDLHFMISFGFREESCLHTDAGTYCAIQLPLGLCARVPLSLASTLGDLSSERKYVQTYLSISPLPLLSYSSLTYSKTNLLKSIHVVFTFRLTLFSFFFDFSF